MTLFYLMVAFVVVIAIVGGLGYRRNWHWTGLPGSPGDGTSENPSREPKTLWDWMQLLIVPLVLAVAAFGLNAAQADRQSQQQDQQATRARQIAEDEAEENALHAYIQQMSDLILHDRLVVPVPARANHPTHAQILARTLTLVALRRMDGGRKATILEFLWEAGLITQARRWEMSPGQLWVVGEETRAPIVTLTNADLRGLDAREAQLAPIDAQYESEARTDERSKAARQVRAGIDLDGADLRGANLRYANLSNASFKEANVVGVNFEYANLSAAVFSQACLDDTKFSRAHLSAIERLTPGASLDFAEGDHVDFDGALMEATDLRGSVFKHARTAGAAMSEAQLPDEWTPRGNPTALPEAPNRCFSPAAGG
jgi:uncharacterized protein YjbI with pentapeptide repeats